MIERELTRLLLWIARRCDAGALALHRRYYQREAIKAARWIERRDATTVEHLIASTVPVTRVGSPTHREL